MIPSPMSANNPPLPPFDQFSVTYPLSVKEAHAVQASIIAHEESVSSLEKRIDDLRKILETLQLKYRSQAETLVVLRSMKSPVHCLPAEVLGRIFQHARWEASDNRKDPPNIRSLSHPLRRVSQVCRRWREVAVNTPQLWTAMLIKPVADRWYLRDSSAEEFRKLNMALELWVTRSQPYPICINFTEDEPIGGRTQGREPPHQQQVFMTALRRTTHRWRSFQATLYSDQQGMSYWPILDAVPGTLGGLEELHLEILLQDSTFVVPPIPLLQAPNLRELHLDYWEPTWRIPAWGHLEHLVIGRKDWAKMSPRVITTKSGLTDAMAFEVLRASPKLRTCTLHLHGIENARRLSSMITLPYLESVTIVCPQFDALAEHLHLPSLRRVSLYKDRKWPHSLTIGWVNQFGGQLEDVVLDNVAHDALHLENILEKLPNVVSLEVVCHPNVFNKKVLLRLTPSKCDAGSLLCPSLMTMKFKLWTLGDTLDERVPDPKEATSGLQNLELVELFKSRLQLKPSMKKMTWGMINWEGFDELLGRDLGEGFTFKMERNLTRWKLDLGWMEYRAKN